MPAFKPAAQILREQLASDDILCCPGVYDGFTARLALAAGFPTLYMTGAGTSASLLGSPDLAFITLTEMLQNASMIASLDQRVPVIADADTGFGGPLNVGRTVKAYINANIAALHIEDQSVSKRCGHLAGKVLVSKEEFRTRITAASEARKESGRDIVIIARSDALQSYGFDEAIERLQTAVAAGADVAFLEGVENEDQMRKACKILAPTACLVNMVPGGATPVLSAQKAKEIGYKIQIWPIVALSEVFARVGDIYKTLKDTGYADPPEKGRGEVRDIFNVCGLQDCAAFDDKVGGTAYSKGV